MSCKFVRFIAALPLKIHMLMCSSSVALRSFFTRAMPPSGGALTCQIRTPWRCDRDPIARCDICRLKGCKCCLFLWQHATICIKCDAPWLQSSDDDENCSTQSQNQNRSGQSQSPNRSAQSQSQNRSAQPQSQNRSSGQPSQRRFFQGSIRDRSRSRDPQHRDCKGKGKSK